MLKQNFDNFHAENDRKFKKVVRSLSLNDLNKFEIVTKQSEEKHENLVILNLKLESKNRAFSNVFLYLRECLSKQSSKEESQKEQGKNLINFNAEKPLCSRDIDHKFSENKDSKQSPFHSLEQH
ncbi:unnamed protein product [Brachionus calyciflorus]|uniref:Uncharacterized protein n=1 Tax=Brachionus calyciflorus TaxID=104777 RepID=A0A814JW57_9BILA|nr:unnamed protein product [Brachionus calyciflorus]